MMDNYRTVRIGTTQSQRKLFYNLRKTRDRLSQMGINPSPSAIAKELNVKHKEVLEMQMRLNQPETLQTLGSQFGVSRERIRQVEKRIIEKLKKYIFNQVPDIKQFSFC